VASGLPHWEQQDEGEEEESANVSTLSPLFEKRKEMHRIFFPQQMTEGMSKGIENLKKTRSGPMFSLQLASSHSSNRQIP
jgi:hypothetical protein